MFPSSGGSTVIAAGVWAAALVASLLLAASAEAQVYRCEEGGRTVFRDKPCAGAGGAVDARPATGGGSSAAAPRSTTAAPTRRAEEDDLARRCAAGSAEACRTQQVLGRHQRDMDDLAQRCRGGEARACDTLACVQASDRAACARAESRSTGNGWHETGRRVETRPGRRADGSASGERYTVVSLGCDHGGRGVAELGPGGVRIPGQSTVFASLDAAARHLCSQPR